MFAIIQILAINSDATTTAISHGKLQSAMMDMLFVKELLTNQNSWNIAMRSITHRRKNPQDVCSWVGVECSHSRVTSLYLQDDIGRLQELTLNMLWLAPSIQHLHLGSMSFSAAIATPALPRDLRYFFVHACMVRVAIQPADKINLTKLPDRLEEFMFTHAYAVRGGLDLRRLPQTLCLLALTTHLAMDRGREPFVLADELALPEALTHIFIIDTQRSAEVKIINTGEKEADDRISTFFTGPMQSYSQYAAKYGQMCRDENAL